MLIRRKEQKTYGRKNLIDGEDSFGDNVIVIEDVITSGDSILETVVVSIVIMKLKFLIHIKQLYSLGFGDKQFKDSKCYCFSR